MKFEIVVTDNFKKEAKLLFKKYPSLKIDLDNLINKLEKNPKQGTALGKDCFKIRFAIKSKGKGKSGGSRIITCVKIYHSLVFLLSIYDKGDKESIYDIELDRLLKASGLL